MNDFIKNQEDNGKQAVFSRNLHKFFEVATLFHKWIVRMFKYGFKESADYEAVDIFVRPKNGIGRRNSISYALTL